MVKIDDRMPALTDCKGYDAFYDDMWRCKNALTMGGPYMINAEVWLDLLAKLSNEELHDYVDRYEPGLLDPFAQHNLPQNAAKLH